MEKSFLRFVRGSREISPVSSLYRESTDSLIQVALLKMKPAAIMGIAAVKDAF